MRLSVSWAFDQPKTGACPKASGSFVPARARAAPKGEAVGKHGFAGARGRVML